LSCCTLAICQWCLGRGRHHTPHEMVCFHLP
jgi:hypothetical protein